MTAARRAAAHAMADLTRFYVSMGASIYYNNIVPEPETTDLASIYTRIDATYRQCSRLDINFEANIISDTLDVLLEGGEFDEEARKFAAGFANVAYIHFNTIRERISEEEHLLTKIAEAKISARLALGDPLEDNGDSDYAEARYYVDAMALRHGKMRLAELKDRNRIFLNAVAQAA